MIEYKRIKENLQEAYCKKEEEKSRISLSFYWKKMCDVIVHDSVIPESCTLPMRSLFEPRLVALFHQSQFISGCKANVSVGQKPGSDGKICKAASRLKDSNHAHLVQERAG